MLRLDSTTKLQAVLSAAVATTQPQATVCYSDDDGSGAYPGGKQLTALNNAADVDICAAPAAGVVRDIDYLSILNRDSGSVTITIKYDVGGTDSPITTIILATLETLVYTHASGWECKTSDGKLKTQAANFPGGASGDVQYNNGSGAFGAESAFNYNPTTDTLSVSKIITTMPSLNGGPLAGMRNKIIGGDFSTNPWQRGTSFANPSGVYSADRWIMGNNSAAIVSVSKSPFPPLVAQVGRFVSDCMLLTCTTADTSVEAGDILYIGQRIEGYNFQGLAQRPMVLSFWHAHTRPGSYCVSITNSGNDRSFVGEYTQAAANTWEYTAIAIPASLSSGTWNYTNGVGILVAFVLMGGATYQTVTPGVWQNGFFFATANQVNGVNAVNNFFALALVQLEPGTIATPFEDLPVQTVLQLCQRYFCKSYAIGTPPGTLTGVNLGELGWPAIVGGAVTNFSSRIHFPVLMRAIPTMTFFNPLVANGQVRNAGTNADCSATAVNNTVDSGFQLTCTQDAGAAANNQLRVHWTANAEL